LVMVALALPFAYLHARAGGVSFKVFGGIMLGISFVLLNNLSGHIGLLRGWTPWVSAAAPSLMYLMLSLVAFTWLVRYR
jgi:lipopolysaccharide export system permease protein